MKHSVAIAIVLLLAAVGAVAHEGHDRKVMGTVSKVDATSLEVKAAKDGKVSTITLNDKTKILRDRTPVTTDDIKPGERVVVTAVMQKDKSGKDLLVAKEVRLASATE